MNVNDYYNRLLSKRSNINEHLPLIREYASLCNHVTEFGFGTGRSAAAILMSQPRTFVSYDIKQPRNLKKAKEMSKSLKVEFVFHRVSTLDCDIESTDMLFIDSLHTYNQLYNELLLHSDKVGTYIIMHDTETFGDKDEHAKKSDGKMGLRKAISDFLKERPWQIVEHKTNNNGLTIMKRISPG